MEIINKNLILNGIEIKEEQVDFRVINEVINMLIKGDLSKENFKDDNSSPYLSLVINEIIECNIEDDSFDF